MKTINTITIIGWWWNFWKFLKKELEHIWFQVFTILENTQNEEKIRFFSNSDVIIFSVPIRKTIEVIRNSINFWLKENTLLIDVSWVKNWINEELERLGTSEFVSIHPMFWPSVQSLKGKNLIQTSSENDVWKKWKLFRRLLKKAWGNIKNMSELEHDDKMSLIQSTSHFLNLIFWNLLKSLRVKLEDLDDIWTPNFKWQEEIFLRILRWQSWTTFSDMQIHNSKFRNEVLDKILECTLSLWNIVRSWDSGWFEKMFQELQKEFILEND